MRKTIHADHEFGNVAHENGGGVNIPNMLEDAHHLETPSPLSGDNADKRPHLLSAFVHELNTEDVGKLHEEILSLKSSLTTMRALMMMRQELMKQRYEARLSPKI